MQNQRKEKNMLAMNFFSKTNKQNQSGIQGVVDYTHWMVTVTPGGCMVWRSTDCSASNLGSAIFLPDFFPPKSITNQVKLYIYTLTKLHKFK